MIFLDKFFNFVSNIIKTNKSKTATAPTYTIIRRRAKNSLSKNSNSIATNKKLKIKNNKAKKVFWSKTIHKELINRPVRKK